MAGRDGQPDFRNLFHGINFNQKPFNPIFVKLDKTDERIAKHGVLTEFKSGFQIIPTNIGSILTITQEKNVFILGILLYLFNLHLLVCEKNLYVYQLNT